MKALICQKPGTLEYDTRPNPESRAGRVVIRIRRIGICGTDLHAFEGTQPFFNYPRILGHELSGDLAEEDNLAGMNRGDIVSFIPYFNCGTCTACRSGKTNCCVSMQVCGVHVDGGMAEYLSVPTTSLLSGRGFSLDELALLEPFAVGAHGIRRAAIRSGDFVLVIGAGPIGLATMQFAGLAGARVIAMDVSEQRLEFCKSKMKIPYVLNANLDDAMLREITEGEMATVVIDATGNLKAINNAFRYMAHGGKYVLIGLQKGDISFSHPEFHKREGTLMSSRNATREDFEYVMNCVSKKLIRPTEIITHRAPFDDLANRFGSWLSPRSGVIKAMVEVP